MLPILLPKHRPLQCRVSLLTNRMCIRTTPRSWVHANEKFGVIFNHCVTCPSPLAGGREALTGRPQGPGATLAPALWHQKFQGGGSKARPGARAKAWVSSVALCVSFALWESGAKIVFVGNGKTP